MARGKKTGGKAVRFEPGAAEAIQAYAWPGNVRELEHAIERMLIMAGGAAITTLDLPPEIQPPSPSGAPAPERLEELERKHILAALESCRGNQAEAAKRLGIGRNTLWRKIKGYGLPKPD